MLDDQQIEQLVKGAIDGLEVPADGPARVLAARTAGTAAGGVPDDDDNDAYDSVGVPIRRGPRTRLVLIAAAVAVLVFVVGAGVVVVHHHRSRVTSTAVSGLAPVGAAVPAPVHAASGAAGSAGTGSGASTFGGASASAGVAAPANGPGAGAAGSPPAGDTPSSGGAPASAAVPSLPTQVIKTGSMSLVVGRGQLGATMNRLTAIAVGLGGYVDSSQTNQAGGTPPTTPTTTAPGATSVPPPPPLPSTPAGVPAGEATLRVPVAQFETLVSQVETVGKVTALSTTGQDVTSQDVDLKAQIQALQATRTQLLQVMAKAQAVSDILAVEQQISPVESQIEQLQGQEKVLEDQAAYGTLAVTVTEQAPTVVTPPPPKPPKPPNGLTRAWRHARHSFLHGGESVVSASGGIAVFLLCVLALGLVGWIGWRVVRRRLV